MSDYPAVLSLSLDFEQLSLIKALLSGCGRAYSVAQSGFVSLYGETTKTLLSVKPLAAAFTQLIRKHGDFVYLNILSAKYQYPNTEKPFASSAGGAQRPGIAEVAAFVLFSFSFVLSLHPCSCVQHLFFSRYFGNTMLGDVRKEQTLSQAWFFYRRLLRQFRDCRSSRRFSLTVPVPRVLP